MSLLIDNCSASDFEFVCPKKWSELRKSYVEGVRYCDQCKKNVYLCRTDADIKLYDSVNYCIAISNTQYEQRRLAPSTPPDSQNSAPAAEEEDDRVPFVGVWAKKEWVRERD